MINRYLFELKSHLTKHNVQEIIFSQLRVTNLNFWVKHNLTTDFINPT